MRGMAVVSVALVLAGCGGTPNGYPDLPKIPAQAASLGQTRAVQKWAENSCLYNLAGVLDLAGANLSDRPSYGELASALYGWFVKNDPDVLAKPADFYHAAVFTGCFAGLDRHG